MSKSAIPPLMQEPEPENTTSPLYYLLLILVVIAVLGGALMLASSNGGSSVTGRYHVETVGQHQPVQNAVEPAAAGITTPAVKAASVPFLLHAAVVLRRTVNHPLFIFAMVLGFIFVGGAVALAYLRPNPSIFGLPVTIKLTIPNGQSVTLDKVDFYASLKDTIKDVNFGADEALKGSFCFCLRNADGTRREIQPSTPIWQLASPGGTLELAKPNVVTIADKQYGGRIRSTACESTSYSDVIYRSHSYILGFHVKDVDNNWSQLSAAHLTGKEPIVVVDSVYGGLEIPKNESLLWTLREGLAAWSNVILQPGYVMAAVTLALVAIAFIHSVVQFSH